MYSLDDYFRSQQVPLQWSPVLHALAQELSSLGGVDTEVLHALFIKVGTRFAKSVETQFQGVETLAELTESINDFWSRTQWGWVSISEGENHLTIEHRYAPLTEAFGAEMLNWTVGILEGFYQTVFRAFSASDKLKARCLEQQDDGFCLHLRLAP
jgi:hypothetical protein